MFGGGAVPKAIEFISALRDKTASGKVEWKEWEKGLSAALPNGVLVYFQCTTKPPYQWTFFAVQVGKEAVFQLKKNLPDSLMSMAEGDLQSANDLFTLIVSKRVHPLDKALESIKGI